MSDISIPATDFADMIDMIDIIKKQGVNLSPEEQVKMQNLQKIAIAEKAKNDANDARIKLMMDTFESFLRGTKSTEDFCDALHRGAGSQVLKNLRSHVEHYYHVDSSDGETTEPQKEWKIRMSKFSDVNMSRGKKHHRHA